MGSESIQVRPKLIAAIVDSMRSSDRQNRSVAVALSTHLCATSNASVRSFVQDALSTWRLQGIEGERYEWLVEQLTVDHASLGEDSSWRTRVMGLINALCAGARNVEDRWHLRWQFGQVGLEEALAVRLRHNV